MRFMSIYKPGQEPAGPPPENEMAALNKLLEEMTEKGVMIGTDGLFPSALGARVDLNAGEFTVTDGPFAETKELIAGYAILECESLEEAVGWTRRFLAVMGQGQCEVRRMHDGADDNCNQPAHAGRGVAAGREF